MNESRLQEELDQIRIDVAELNKKLNDREADLLNVRAETLKEVGEYIDQQYDILAKDLGYRLAFFDGLVEALQRGELPKE